MYKYLFKRLIDIVLSMKINTLDVPTHLLEHPEQYISRIGAFLRKRSLDELPQIFQIFADIRGIVGTTNENPNFTSMLAA